MSYEQRSIFDGAGPEYRAQLEHQLSVHLAVVSDHASGENLSTPWEFEAALVALRWIADELRALSLSDGDVPF